MKFSKNLVFLGIRAGEFTGSDGKLQTYYTVSFFDPEAVSPLQVNVVEDKKRIDMINLLVDSSLGQSLTVGFHLRAQDKLYKLQIDDVKL